MKTKPRLSFTLITSRNGKALSQTVSSKYRRILQKIQVEQNPDCTFYLCVRYGKFIDNYDHSTPFYNDGYYDTKESLLQALRAFCEP